jgi:excisionase family DNA binding protein
MSAEEMATQDVAPSPDRFLTAKEVAERLNVHVSTVYRLGRRLDAQRLGIGEVRPRGFRVAESKLDALMQNREAA